MIGKAGAKQEIDTYLFEITDFIDETPDRIRNAIPDWKIWAKRQIDRTLQIVYSNGDASVEVETPDCPGGLKFNYIRRGYGAEGAQVSFNRADDALEIRFWTKDGGDTASFEYKKDPYYRSLSFKRSDTGFMFYEEEN